MSERNLNVSDESSETSDVETSLPFYDDSTNEVCAATGLVHLANELHSSNNSCLNSFAGDTFKIISVEDDSFCANVTTDYKYDGSNEKSITSAPPMTFPQKLMEILSDETLNEIISWLPHGRGFIIYQKKKFAAEALPKYFKQVKFTSFTRKLNRWLFIRITRGQEAGAYYHEYFQRGKPQMCLMMSCHSGPTHLSDRDPDKFKNNRGALQHDNATGLETRFPDSAIPDKREEIMKDILKLHYINKVKMSIVNHQLIMRTLLKNEEPKRALPFMTSPYMLPNSTMAIRPSSTIHQNGMMQQNVSLLAGLNRGSHMPTAHQQRRVFSTFSDKASAA